MPDTRKLPRLLPWAAITVALIAVFVALGGPSYAGTVVRRAITADKVDGIHASKTPKAGRLLPLDRKAKLPASVLPRALTGAPGEPGETGEQGEQGEPGRPGEKGDTGARGLSGPAGQQGAKGDTGAEGPKGDTGPSNSYVGAKSTQYVSTTSTTGEPIITLNLPAGDYLVTATGTMVDLGSANLLGTAWIQTPSDSRYVYNGLDTTAHRYSGFSLTMDAKLTAGGTVRLMSYKPSAGDVFALYYVTLTATKVGTLTTQ